MTLLTEAGSTLVIGSLPLLALLGWMSPQVFFVVWVYGVGFAGSILTFFSHFGQIAATSNPVGKDERVTPIAAPSLVII